MGFGQPKTPPRARASVPFPFAFFDLRRPDLFLSQIQTPNPCGPSPFTDAWMAGIRIQSTDPRTCWPIALSTLASRPPIPRHPNPYRALQGAPRLDPTTNKGPPPHATAMDPRGGPPPPPPFPNPLGVGGGASSSQAPAVRRQLSAESRTFAPAAMAAAVITTTRPPGLNPSPTVAARRVAPPAPPLQPYPQAKPEIVLPAMVPRLTALLPLHELNIFLQVRPTANLKPQNDR